uniref:Anoctamin n=1 Tax=Callorhinchus milii TaxID=7868 RepID=A0A4W3HXF1_CALMI
MTGNVSALPYLLMKNIIKSAFTLHDNVQFNNNRNSNPTSLEENNGEIHIFQPLGRIRNYFGEKISFYFALMETLLISLVVPAFLGVVVFLYGIYIRFVYNNKNNTITVLAFGMALDL